MHQAAMEDTEGFTKLIPGSNKGFLQLGQLEKKKIILVAVATLGLLSLIIILVAATAGGGGGGGEKRSVHRLHTNECTFPSIEGGYLVCEGKEELVCLLECFTGYVKSLGKNITCSAGRWEPKQQLSCEKAVALVIGGATSSDHWNEVELYSPSGDCNKFLPSLPSSRSSHTSQLLGSTVVTCGAHQPAIQSTCIQWTTKDKKWNNHSSLYYPRDDHSSAIVEGKMYVIGGSSPTVGKSTEFWNGKKWSLGPSTRGGIGRIDSSCVVGWKDTYMIVTGGYYSLNEAWMLHVPSMTWTRLPDMIRRRSHGCVLMQNKNRNVTGVLVAGGSNGGKTTEFLNMNVKPWRWVRMGDMVADRHSFSLVAVGGEKGQVLALGGWGKGSSRLKSVEILEKDVWSLASFPLKNAKSSFSVVAVPETMCQL